MPKQVLSFIKKPAVLQILLIITAIAVYSWLLNPAAALLLLFAVYSHELGHALATKLMGGKIKGIYMIPMFGGVCVPEEVNMSSLKTFVCLYGGPLVSLLEAAGSWLLFWYSGFSEPLYGALSIFFTLVLSVNILPVYPLDGGQMLSHILDPWHPALEELVRVAIPVVAAFVFFVDGAYVLGGFITAGAVGSLVSLHRTIKKIEPPKSYAVSFPAHLREHFRNLLGAFKSRKQMMSRTESLGCLALYAVTGFLCWLSLTHADANPASTVFLKEMFAW